MVILNFLLGWLIPGVAVLIGVPLAIRELWRHEREVAAGKWSLKEEQEQEPDADALVLGDLRNARVQEQDDDVLVLRNVRGGRVMFWTASSAAFGPSDLN